MSSPTGSASPIDLSRFRAKACVALMFTPTVGDPRGIRQRMALKTNADGIIERDVVRIEVNGDEPTRRPLREQFGVPLDQFTFILVGKDGVERLRSTEPVDAAELFSVIDTLPCQGKDGDKEDDG